MLYNALSMGKKTPKTAHFPWDFVTLPEDDGETAIGNMQRKDGKDRACGSGDILADRQTEKQTDRQTCSPVITILKCTDKNAADNSTASFFASEEPAESLKISIKVYFDGTLA